MKLLYLLGLILVLFGCITTADAPQNTSIVENATYSFEKYENIGISFDYPQGAKVVETLDSYPGYAVVAIGDSVTNGSILVVFMNMSSLEEGLEGTSEELAAGFLEAQSKQDNMGVLHQASSKGNITSYESPEGFGIAEMTFSMMVENLDKSQAILPKHGYAMEFYDVDKKTRYGVRIFADEMGVAETLKERLVSSFRYSDIVPMMEEKNDKHDETPQEEILPEPGCIDSDGGISIRTKGKVTGPEETAYWDSCEDEKNLKEYYCKNDVLGYEIIDCGAGFRCEDGGCKFGTKTGQSEDSKSECKETDGLDYDTYGYSEKDGIKYGDVCTGANTLKEYYCHNGEVLSSEFECPGGLICRDGNCVPQ